MYFTFSHFLATKHSQKKKNLVANFSSHSPEPKLPNNSITTNKLSVSLSSPTSLETNKIFVPN